MLFPVLACIGQHTDQDLTNIRMCSAIATCHKRVRDFTAGGVVDNRQQTSLSCRRRTHATRCVTRSVVHKDERSVR